MAGCAIRVTATGFGWIGCCLFTISSLVLMVMVTEVFGCGPSFVLAIGCNRCPTELQRHQYQQKNHKQATHGQDCSSYSVLAEGPDSAPLSRPLKKWASNASGTLFSKKRVAQTRLRSDCTGQSGLFAGHLAHFGRTYPRAHA